MIGFRHGLPIGRVHRQKGIDDLLKTLQYLNTTIPNFRAVIIGKVKADLQPMIERLPRVDCRAKPAHVRR